MLLCPIAFLLSLSIDEEAFHNLIVRVDDSDDPSPRCGCYMGIDKMAGCVSLRAQQKPNGGVHTYIHTYMHICMYTHMYV